MSWNQLAFQQEVQLDYTRIQNLLIEKYIKRNWKHKRYHKRGIEPLRYVEAHHVIPKSLGGRDNDSNIVVITPREHFVLHRILTKTTPCSQTWAALAALRMSRSSHARLNSRQFDIARTASKLARVGPLSDRQLVRHHELHLGKKRSQLTCRRISEAKKGRPGSGIGVPLSEAHRAKLRGPRILSYTTCPHCNMVGAKNNMNRYHFDNCKLVPAVD